jgi:hypothetical protein
MENTEEARLKILKQIINLPVEEKIHWLESYKILYPGRDVEADITEYLGNTTEVKGSFENAMDSFLGGAKLAKDSFLDDVRLAMEKLRELEGPANEIIDKGLDRVAKVGSELFEKAKDKYGEFSKNASNMKYEDDLSKNFNEDKFVSAVLSGKITFSYSTQKKYDFLDFSGTENRWTSDNDYFSLVVDEENKVLFKINKIDYRQHMRRIVINSLPRIYNVVIYGKDSKEIVDPTLKF